MHPAIAEQTDDIVALCKRYGVVRLEVFGSAARGVDFDPQTSDADFVVEFDRMVEMGAFDQYFGFLEEMRELLDRPVDLVDFRTIDNPHLRASINRSREIVYAA